MRNIVLWTAFFLAGLGVGGTTVHLRRREPTPSVEGPSTGVEAATAGQETTDRVLKDAEVNRLITELKGWREKRDREWRKIEEEKAKLAQARAALQEAERRVASLRESLMAQIVQIGAAQQKNVKQLAAIYGKMDPVAAAQLLSKLPEADAAMLVYSMQDRNAAQLLAAYASLGEEERSAAAKLTGVIKHLAPPDRGSGGVKK
jgi:flagellar motility protein MotE (MotC chaperone)